MYIVIVKIACENELVSNKNHDGGDLYEVPVINISSKGLDKTPFRYVSPQFY